jgi:hypothetical protein
MTEGNMKAVRIGNEDIKFPEGMNVADVIRSWGKMHEIEGTIRKQFPDAEIIAYYDTTNEMTFFPNGKSLSPVSCKLKDGGPVFNWDF